MDAQFYKSLKVPRGYTYGYYHRLPAPEKNLPTIVFSHGYPSTSRDWAAQVAYFTNKGYGVVVPDLLGYGRTDKPSDLAAYKTLEISKDVASILDKEGIHKVLLVGHDWGAWVVSRFINAFPERVLGVAYLSVGYMPPPSQPFDLEAIIGFCRQTFGNDRVGYWTLFATEDGAEIMDKNIDSLYDILFPADPEIWKTHMTPKGALRSWVSEGRRRTDPLPRYWDEKARREHQDAILRSGGFSAPNKWYLSQIAGHNDDPTFDASKKIDLPVFLGTALRDYVSLAEPEKQMQRNFIEEDRLTIHEFDTGHWVMMEAPDEVNARLEKFFVGLY